MKVLLLSTLLPAVFLPLARSSDAPSQGVREDYASVHARAEALRILRRDKPHTFRADIAATLQEANRKSVRGRGEILVGGRGRIRLSMTFPGEKRDFHMLVIADGKHLWTRTLERMREREGDTRVRNLHFTRAPLDPEAVKGSERLEAVLQLLEIDPVVLLERAREKYSNLRIERQGEHYVLEGTIPSPPRNPGEVQIHPRRVRLRMRVLDLVLVEETYLDEKGAPLSSIRMSAVRTGLEHIRPEAFRMEVPEGHRVEVIGEAKDR